MKNERHILICSGYRPVLRALAEHNVDYITITDSKILPKPVAGHADMMVYNAGGGKIMIYDKELSEKLTALGYSCICPHEAQGGSYPNDVKLNCLRIGNALIANTKYCAEEVLQLAETDGLRIFHVAQGYARCSTAIVGENAAITADAGIAEALRSAGVDVLLISAGHIGIEQYAYGFIGGCCAMISPDRLLTAGNLMNHPDGRSMVDFIRSHKIDILTAHTDSNDSLWDFGGAVII